MTHLILTFFPAAGNKSEAKAHSSREKLSTSFCAGRWPVLSNDFCADAVLRFMSTSPELRVGGRRGEELLPVTE